MASGDQPDELEDLETAGQVIAVGDKIAVSVGKIEEMLQTANVGADAYSNALEAFSGAISLDDGKEVQALIAKMMQQTQEMQQQNNMLRDQLAHSSDEVKELRGNLESVKREAMTDVLTDIGNRKYFDIKLRELADKAMTEGEPVSLLLFDVDNFKDFNDSHGHQLGARLIRGQGDDRIADVDHDVEHVAGDRAEDDIVDGATGDDGPAAVQNGQLFLGHLALEHRLLVALVGLVAVGL